MDLFAKTDTATGLLITRWEYYNGALLLIRTFIYNKYDIYDCYNNIDNKLAIFVLNKHCWSISECLYMEGVNYPGHLLILTDPQI